MDRSGDRLILGTRKGLIILERDGADWRKRLDAHAGIPIPYATVDARASVLWASLDHGHWGQKLQRSNDLGESWEEIEAPKYPDGLEVKDGVEATLRYLWVVQPGGADEPDKLYIGTEPGGLFVTSDAGDRWTLVESLWNHPSRKEQWFGGGRDHAGIHSIVVDPRDSLRVLVGVSCAGVFETVDGGESWQPRNRGLKASYLPDPNVEVGHDPHLLVTCAGEPDVLWQQNHCGIFRSTDGGRRWSDVTEPGGPARFGFAIAVDPTMPDTAWVIPAKDDDFRVAIDGALCVCRTDDGGATWRALRNGLPQENCYDIVFRHALDVHDDRVAFGSTTGNLFVSDDRGESWRSVGHHFPQIYSVRFA